MLSAKFKRKAKYLVVPAKEEGKAALRVEVEISLVTATAKVEVVCAGTGNLKTGTLLRKINSPDFLTVESLAAETKVCPQTVAEVAFKRLTSFPNPISPVKEFSIIVLEAKISVEVAANGKS